MAITTWLSAAEINNYKSVTDKDLNELFQEIRSIDVRFYLQEYVVETKRFFRKKKVEVLYSMYIHLCDEDFQIMNFCRHGKRSINTVVPGSYIYTYFYGFLGGLKYQTKARINPI